MSFCDLEGLAKPNPVKLDEFQRVFHDLRQRQHKLHELIEARRKVFEQQGPHDKDIPRKLNRSIMCYAWTATCLLID